MLTLTVDNAVAQLKKIYCTAIKKNMPPNFLPSVMLWGPPGVGKSQGVRQLALEIQGATGKTVCVTDVRLLLFNPIDLRGIPTANADKTLAVWLKPKIFQMDESKSVINILFLDEISAAPQSVQAAAYQITLDRTVGEHRLPENCIVIAAGNRITDKSVAYKMPKALANRLCHFEIKSDFQSWKAWAIKKGINEKIIGYLTFRQTALDKFEADDSLAFPTPRSWEMASCVLNAVSGDVEAVYPMIAGCVGLGVAIEFRTWVKVYESLPSIEDIFSGKETVVPVQPDSLYAIVSSMAAHANRKKTDLTGIAHSIKYALKMPPDFSMILIKDYFAFGEEFRKKLMKLPELMDWLKNHGKYMI
jgi:hypothetical protein